MLSTQKVTFTLSLAEVCPFKVALRFQMRKMTSHSVAEDKSALKCFSQPTEISHEQTEMCGFC